MSDEKETTETTTEKTTNTPAAPGPDEGVHEPLKTDTTTTEKVTRKDTVQRKD